MTDREYIQGVLAKLSSNPTAGDLDYFIEAHARVGYLVAIATGAAEQREAERKYREASLYAEARTSGAKSSVDATAAATIGSKSERDAEIAARSAAMKLKNLLDSIEQCVNGIKYLGRATDVNLPGMRR